MRTGTLCSVEQLLCMSTTYSHICRVNIPYALTQRMTSPDVCVRWTQDSGYSYLGNENGLGRANGRTDRGTNGGEELGRV